MTVGWTWLNLKENLFSISQKVDLSHLSNAMNPINVKHFLTFLKINCSAFISWITINMQGAYNSKKCLEKNVNKNVFYLDSSTRVTRLRHRRHNMRHRRHKMRQIRRTDGADRETQRQFLIHLVIKYKHLNCKLKYI